MAAFHAKLQGHIEEMRTAVDDAAKAKAAAKEEKRTRRLRRKAARPRTVEPVRTVLMLLSTSLLSSTQDCVTMFFSVGLRFSAGVLQAKPHPVSTALDSAPVVRTP